MKIAIIGAGFTGLAAATDLQKQGHSVVVYEASSQAGGLAAGFTKPGWDWTIEKHYHHVFETDLVCQQFLQEFGLVDQLVFARVRTATLYQGVARLLDSPISLLQYGPLSWLARLRMAVGLAFLKIWPWGKWLDRWSAASWIKQIMGQESWQKVWRPLFVGKFGQYAEKVNLAWFWARIVARSAALGFYQGGFSLMAQTITKLLAGRGVEFHFQSPIVGLSHAKHGWQVDSANGSEQYDKVLVAAESGVILKLLAKKARQPAQLRWVKQQQKLKGLGAMTLVLELDQPFFADQTYWLNVNEPGWPFLAVVEQTNLTGSTGFANHTVVYVGKYGDPTSAAGERWFSQTPEELFVAYQPYLEKLSPGFSQHVIQQWVFKEKFAQPLVFTHHNQVVPHIETPWQGMYWASMQHVYPWDRGINFAIAIGRAAARTIART